jgi:hypothetical protein
MVPHSLNIASSDGGSQVLWEDGEHAHSEAERGNGCGSRLHEPNVTRHRFAPDGF